MRTAAVLCAVLAACSGGNDDGGDDGPAVCGDGVRSGTEGCDDGNNDDEDGCDADCNLESDEEPAMIEATWTFETVGGANDGCVDGIDIVAIVSQPLDLTGVPVGNPVVDLYNCEDEQGVTQDLPGGDVYVYLEARRGMTTVVAQTLGEVVDISEVDQIVDFTFYTDGGYFNFAWTLRGATTGNELTCTSVPGLDGIGFLATLMGSTEMTDQDFDCDPMENTTDPIQNGTWIIAVDAINSTGQSLGQAPPRNGTLTGLNSMVDLGSFEISVTGQ